MLRLILTLGSFATALTTTNSPSSSLRTSRSTARLEEKTRWQIVGQVAAKATIPSAKKVQTKEKWGRGERIGDCGSHSLD